MAIKRLMEFSEEIVLALKGAPKAIFSVILLNVLVGL